MKITPTPFDDLFIIEPNISGDARGYFTEVYNQKDMELAGLNIQFVQDNQSRSKKGVLRGLHFQNKPYAQTKLIRVLTGNVLDVVVDLRKAKKTYKQTFTIALNGEEHKQILIPKGFAHGFLVTSEYADVFYKTDAHYHPESEGGINFFDPELGLVHSFNGLDVVMSEKDRSLPFISQAIFSF